MEQVFNFFKGSVVLFFILPLVACPSWGQVVQKKELSPADYHLWAETHVDKVSNSEKWASYKVEYKSGLDTLYLRNVTDNTTFYFAGGDNSAFIKDDFFICQTPNDLHIVNLHTFKTEIVQGVMKYDYCNATGKLLISRSESDEKSSLLIRTPDKTKDIEIQDVADFYLSPAGRYVIYSSPVNNQNGVHLLDLSTKDNAKCLSEGMQIQFKNFTWQDKGKSLAFLATSTDTKISSVFYYILKNDKIYEFKPHEHVDFPKDASIYWDPFYKIVISDDMKRVFFSVKKDLDSASNDDKTVEIWNGNDKWIYPHDQKSGRFKTAPKVGVWFPELNVFKLITTEKTPKLMLTGNLQNAVLYNPKDYEPQFEVVGPSDFYILNLKTFKKELFLKKQFGARSSVLPSPSGKYIAYFKNENWWVYDMILKSNKNITKDLGVKFTSKNQTLVPTSLCGSPGWSINDDEILIYDQYDIWAVKPDGNSFRRLTHGRESKIVFRIAVDPHQKGLNYIYDGSKTKSYNLKEELFLRAVGEDCRTGYFSWNPDSGEKILAYRDSFIDEFNYGIKKEKFIFMEQKFDLSPYLQSIGRDLKSSLLYRSNPQQEKYFWGKSELLYYQNSKGQNLKSVLLYPSNYDPKLKYPMIVHIYEIQSKELHRYSNPSLRNEGGFNPCLFTSKGYFVLMPDILLEQGNPGLSATDCVLSATGNVIDSGLVDPGKIGLMGHSFGGYETSFIVTQTSMFAAAVPSGAITDLNSFYFNVNQKSGDPNMWRFQSEHWSMGKSPFEASDLYAANSPIVHAEKITAPLLLWSGKDDQQVDPRQSLEYYLALRMLGKKSIMLLYPGEGHALTSAASQQDVTVRILQWFDYFLKNERNFESNWITEGVM